MNSNSKIIKKKFPILTCVFFGLVLGLTSCSSINLTRKNGEKENIKIGLSNYTKLAEELVNQIDNNATSKDIGKKASLLMDSSITIFDQIVASGGSCSSYLSEVKMHKSRMTELTPDEMEDLYHEGEALPKMDLGHCEELKELLVHPATVMVLLKHQDNGEGRGQMKSEIVEVLGHLRTITL